MITKAYPKEVEANKTDSKIGLKPACRMPVDEVQYQ
jgi:hypothetical protein